MLQSWISSLASGAAGAVALTAVHELGRRQLSYAPRMDVLGMRALRRLVPAFANERPRSTRLRRWALAADLVANTLYYSAVRGRSTGRTWRRAAALGLSAGAGALLLPEPMGLGRAPNSERRANQALTMAWYVAGALAAAAVSNRLGAPRSSRRPAARQLVA